MAVHYRIDASKHLVITTLSGSLSFEECADHHRKLAADPGFRPDYRELIDGSAVTTVRLDASAMFSLTMSCPYGPSARRAIYSGASMVNFGVARMFQLLSHGRHGEIQVFRNGGKASDWLERPGSQPGNQGIPETFQASIG